MPLTLTFDIKTLHQIMPTFLYIQKKKLYVLPDGWRVLPEGQL